MIKTTFRATITDKDLDWIQDYKEEHNLKNNAQVLHRFMKVAQNEKENTKQLKDITDVRKQLRFNKEQVAILTEMVSEFLMTQGMQIVGNGIDAEIYKSAKRKVKERISNRMEENGGQLE
ncbi:hypothetical protein [Lactobacillus crispatus]|uniref:Uncharacterized protein n=1 Tax=Lactobacillus crispatus TaxID=47770 RepID=A0AAW6XHT7_9LACO|nr:hypothetical protein [Lactobacillus crispatus]MDK6502405.1 hypothetical protein [Lactobacillus crispatus]PLA29979.1 hypothetical protein CYJ80_06595 [Lactobacillus crispatus]